MSRDKDVSERSCELTVNDSFYRANNYLPGVNLWFTLILFCISFCLCFSLSIFDERFLICSNINHSISLVIKYIISINNISYLFLFPEKDICVTSSQKKVSRGKPFSGRISPLNYEPMLTVLISCAAKCKFSVMTSSKKKRVQKVPSLFRNQAWLAGRGWT